MVRYLMPAYEGDNVRHRWWIDAETKRLADVLADKQASIHRSPILKQGLRWLNEHEPTPEMVAWARETALQRKDCQMSSWIGSDSDADILRTLSQDYDLNQRDVQRLAIRVLAELEGVIPAKLTKRRRQAAG